MQDAHSLCNNLLLKELDSTNINGIKPIDSITVSSVNIEFVEGVQLVNNNKIVMSNHSVYLIDLTLEEYF